MARRAQKCRLLVPEVQKRVIDALRAGGTQRTACAYAGVPLSTFYDALRFGREGKAGFAEFLAEVERAEASSAVAALAAVHTAAKAGQWQAAVWLLEQQASDGRGSSEQTARTNIDTMSRQDFLRLQLSTAEAMFAHYRHQPKASIAAMQALRAVKDARDALDEELARAQTDPWEGLSEDEVRHKLREMAETMPTEHLAILADEYCERMGIPFPLRVAN